MFAEGVGRLALFSVPVTLELELIRLVLVWGSDTVRNEGTLLGISLDIEGSASDDELGGSSGVLASEDSSASEPGDAGLLS